MVFHHDTNKFGTIQGLEKQVEVTWDNHNIF